MICTPLDATKKGLRKLKFPKGYTLCPMSDDITKIKKNTLYVKIKGPDIKYKVFSPYNGIEKGKIPIADLGLSSEFCSIDELKLVLPNILEITARKEHTLPLMQGIPYDKKNKKLVDKIVSGCVDLERLLNAQKQQLIEEFNQLGDQFIKDVQQGRILLTDRLLCLSEPVNKKFTQWLNNTPKKMDDTIWKRMVRDAHEQWHEDFEELLEKSTLKFMAHANTLQIVSDVCSEKKERMESFYKGEQWYQQKEIDELEEHYQASCQMLEN